MLSCGSSAKAASRELRISLRDPQLEYAIEFLKHLRRQRHLPHDPALPALESLDTGNTAVDVDRGRGKRKHFRNARPAPSEHQAEQANFRRHTPGRIDKTLPLGGVEIFPVA